MNPSHIVVSSKQNITSRSGPVLKDGSQVLVRIIEQTGKNKFLGSVAGVRTNIFSTKNLSKGDVFKANIVVKDGVLSLKASGDEKLQLETGLTLKQLTSNNISSPLNMVSSSELASFIQNLGLPPDNLSHMILQQMKNHMIKFDSTLMNKIHDVAQKYKGKETIALELIMSFLQKGMEFHPDELDKVLDSLEKDDEDSKKSENLIQNPFNLSSSGIKSFIKSLFNLPSDCEIGLLSIANSLGTCRSNSGNGSWILLPFQILEKNQIISNGIFRILLSNEKKLIKFCIEAKNDDKELNQYFVINFVNNNCSSIDVCQLKDNQEFESLDLCEKIDEGIKKAGLKVKVEFKDFASVFADGFLDQEISILNGAI